MAVIATTLSLTGGVAHGASLVFLKADDEFTKTTFAAYTADPGETNNVVVSWNPATGTFKLTDYGVIAVLPELHVDELLKGDIAPTLADAVPTLTSCVFLLKSVTCRAPGTNDMTAFVSLADGNDRAAIGGSFDGRIAIGGDAGADTLDAAGAAQTVLAGGAGDDNLDGGSGRDDLFGGPGADRLRGGAGLDREVFRHDVPSMYFGAWEADNATTGVNVSLDGLGNDGQPGEGDNTASDIETIVGSRFDDTVTGSADPNTVDGSLGNDTIDGREGADRLLGDIGNDALTGGAGGDEVFGDGKSRIGHPLVTPDNDTLYLNDGEADRYNCGHGDDAAHVDGFDLFHFTSQIVSNDCEFVGP